MARRTSLIKLILALVGTFVLLAAFSPARPVSFSRDFAMEQQPADTNDPDTALPYPFNNQEGGLYGNNPSNFKEDVKYDPATGQYRVVRTVGGEEIGNPIYMSPEEYDDYVGEQQTAEYWEAKTQNEEVAKAQGRDEGNSLIPQIQVNSEFFRKVFGSNTIDIRPQGYAELRFGGRLQKIDNPLIPERSRSTFTFDFDQRIQLNVTGKIGENMDLKFSYDTEATFAFENQQKLEYNGEEDDIVQKIELGNVSLPLNSTLISGAQSLFGVKGQFQFGKLTLTSVVSQQQSQSSSVNVQGGSTTTDFEIWGDQYEGNRHYFLSQYFRDTYESSLQNMPLITSPVRITKVEVWVTNTRQETQNNRNILAFMDLGERERGAYRNGTNNLPGPDIFAGFSPDRFPDNENNALGPNSLTQTYAGVRNLGQANTTLNAAGFEESTEYTDLSNARKLNAQEFDYHEQLGYISLNTALNQDEVLAVSFQFTAGGRTYQVGEFATDGVEPPNALIVKMLKSPILNVRLPMWDLMMKNVYSLNAYQVNQEDFQLLVLYRDDETGTPVPFLPGDNDLADELLLRVVELDRLNSNGDPQPDGFFDYVPGITIKPQNGRIFFPVLEPFGEDLAERFDDPAEAEEYVFQELYDSTRFVAQNQTNLNKFLLQGQYKSQSSSEISLNAFNIPPGSVVVTAGGVKLIENVDYKVDYNLGRVTILNEGILQSRQDVKVDFENNALFSVQRKSFMGLNADYRVNENLNIGGTVVRLAERPLTQKVNIGDEPIANTMVGLNTNFSKEAPYLTRFTDAIPFIDTKESSNIQVQGEVVRFIPGTPRGIKINDEPTTYLDDFESSQTSIDVKSPAQWRLASTPAGQPTLFPETDRNDLSYGFNRARLAWYNIDPLFHRNDGRTPDNITQNKDLQSLPFVRQVLVNEIFPNLQLDQSQPRNIAVFDMAFYPDERGPYNYDVEPTDVSAGIDEEGKLNSPTTRWAGIMRDMTTTNFEEQNIEFVQFWVMDPYFGNPEAPTSGGDFYMNLGSVSEDILKDGQQAVENGIPAEPQNVDQLDSTRWGLVPRVRPVVTTFDNDPAVRDRQDVGYDLLPDDQERIYTDGGNYLSYLSRVETEYGQGSGAYSQANADPASDNFGYYQSGDLDQANAGILQRYKRWNNPEGNSDPTQVNGLSAFATNIPDIEDINRDQTLSKTETYYQYRISMRPQDLQQVGQNYITDIQETQSPQQPNGERYPVRWIQFKVPVFSPESKVGPIGDFRSIRFMRLFMKNFSERMVLRFAKMELIRGEWRRYNFNLDAFGEEINTDRSDATLFEVNAVSIEQNGSRDPIPYQVPPGIDRQQLFGTTSVQQQNEQALSMRICGLKDGAARAVFKNLNFDMRLYNRLRMFAHAEDGDADSDGQPDNLQDGDLTVFIRLGSDYNQNFYEYELPLEVSDFDATSPEEVWPAANNIDFSLDELKNAKLQRDREFRGIGRSITEAFTIPSGNATITVRGAPNLGNVRTIMIGVRNPKKRLADDPNDDGMSKCAEVWVNELRLTDFDQRGGWAANASVTAQLADFANVQLSGRMSTVGFGSLDQSVSERQKENIYAYNLQTSFSLGKFFSRDFGLRIPMFYSLSEEWKTPQFSPLDPDIEFDNAVENLETEEEKTELKNIAQDYVKQRSLNFTNVRKERNTNPPAGGGPPKSPKPWDISNFSATYAFNETFRRNINTVYDSLVQYRGILNYTYRTNPVPVEPFKTVDFMKGDYWKFIRDFNFNWYPRQFSVIGTLDRSTHRVLQRNVAKFENPAFDFELPRTENNNFTFNRQYSLLWDLASTLKFDFNANMRTRIDEPVDYIDSTGQQITYTQEERRDSIWENLKDFGRPTAYHQTATLNWQVPVNKLPFLEWINTTAQYTADYDWAANSLATQRRPGQGEVPDSLNFGNTIQNSRRIQLNNTFNLVGLYNQIPYLKKVNSGGQRRPNRLRERAPGRRLNPEQEEENKEEEDEETAFDKILEGAARTLMMLRSASANFSRNEGQLLPGYLPKASILGMDDGEGYAPGFGFIAGSQDTTILPRAADNGWLTTSTLQPNPYVRTFTQQMNFRATLEPLNNLRIVLTAQRNESRNLSAFYRYVDTLGTWDWQNPFETQTFSTSYITIGTAFENLKAPDYESEAYQKFLDNRQTISRRLAEQYDRDNPGIDYSPDLLGDPDTAYYRYFDLAQQDVLIPAFLAAYSGRDNPETIDLDPKPKIPLPNWQITYDGLTKMGWAKKLFASATLNHGYRSTYTVSNISTNLLRQQAQQDFPDSIPLGPTGNLLPQNQIGAVVISEQFAPLFGINVKLKNSATVRLEYKKDRNVVLGLTNSQITETKGQEWVVGVGYIIKDVRLEFVKLGPRRESPKSNLELKADLGIRDNITIIRRIVEQSDQVTAGQKIITGKLSADYQISKRVQAKLFYDLNLSRFKTSNAFPLTTHQFGIAVRLNLAG